MANSSQKSLIVLGRFDDEYNGHTEKIWRILENGREMLYVEADAKEKINSDTEFTIRKLGGKFIKKGTVYRATYWEGWETPTDEPIENVESSDDKY